VAKLRNDPVGSREFIEFLNTTSDFAFELRCLERLSQVGFQCHHGGSYVDPVTKKPRQFDIRAQREDKILRVRCAVECKNLSPTFPLLIMCMPRALRESFHELVVSYDPEMLTPQSPFEVSAFRQRCQTLRIDSSRSEYVIGASVGKSVVQVGRGLDGAIIANDAEVFEKWSQALASAQELGDEAAVEGEARGSVFISLILPILVVPNGTLWKVDYTESGSRASDPGKVDRCSFYVGREYLAGDRARGTTLTISHLEFVTLSGLEPLTTNILNEDNSWFPRLDCLADLGAQ
jgi:hypothetical protein